MCQKLRKKNKSFVFVSTCAGNFLKITNNLFLCRTVQEMVNAQVNCCFDMEMEGNVEKQW